MGYAAFKKKGRIFGKAAPSRRGYPTTTELPGVDGGGAPDGGGGGGSAVGSSMPIFLLTNLERLEHFPPRTNCGNALCLERLLVHQHVSFYDILSKFGLCSPSRRSNVAMSFSTAGSKFSPSFFALQFHGCEKMVGSCRWRWVTASGPTWTAAPSSQHQYRSAAPRIRLYHLYLQGPAVPPPEAAAICAARSCTSGNVCPLR